MCSFSLNGAHPETLFLDVILRSPADGGTTKNLEILRGACPELAEGLRMTNRRFLRGACPERLDLNSSTGLAEGLRMTNAAIRRVVGQPLRGIL
jgi:hypothetical protein